MFRVGQKVVCVNAAFCVPCGNNPQWRRYPDLNEILTVTQTGIYDGHAFAGKTTQKLQFAEIGGIAPWFAAARFRPLVERRTSIEVFERLLAPTSPRVTERVR